MSPNTPGLHHVTAISGDPRATTEFYVGTLGLRFVKRTVNHDATDTHHIYFADHEGAPGTTITFFPQGPDGRTGTVGAGQVEATTYAIPTNSVEFWIERLAAHDVEVARDDRAGESVLGFDDPDGIRIELIATDDETVDTTPWPDSPVPPEHQLQGFHSVTLAADRLDATERVLVDVMG